MLQVPIISIVDDDEAIRIALHSLVRSLGHEAFVFTSAEDFLGSPRVQDTSCVIVDVQMPGMSGFDLLDELRARRCGIPIIFITGFPEDQLRRRAETAGAIGFFGKPVGGQAFVGCLDAALTQD